MRVRLAVLLPLGPGGLPLAGCALPAIVGLDLAFARMIRPTEVELPIRPASIDAWSAASVEENSYGIFLAGTRG